MSSPIPSPSPTGSAFALRSAKLTTVALLLETADPGALAAALEAQASGAAPLFENDPVIVDLAKLREADEALAVGRAAAACLRRHGMVPVAARGGSAAQMEAAHAAGLIDAPEGQPSAAPDSEFFRRRRGTRRAAAPAAPAPVPPMIVDRPLRSGQQVYARARDLVVLGAGQLRRRGHRRRPHPRLCAAARPRHRRRARQHRGAHLQHCLEPQLISIAGIYRTTETPLPAACSASRRRCGWTASASSIEPPEHPSS